MDNSTFSSASGDILDENDKRITSHGQYDSSLEQTIVSKPDGEHSNPEIVHTKTAEILLSDETEKDISTPHQTENEIDVSYRIRSGRSLCDQSEVKKVSDSQSDSCLLEEPSSLASSDVTIASPLMEEVKQRAVLMRSEYEEPEMDDVVKDVYHIKWINFRGRRVPIVTQNINGPCPLLSIVNILLLQKKISLMDDIVTSSHLMSCLGDVIVQSIPQDIDSNERANWEHNLGDAITIFHKLQTGLDVNVRFTRVTDFEYTQELSVFDLLHINLYHGWLVDSAAVAEAEAVGNLTYNQLVEFIIHNQNSHDAAKQTQAFLCKEFIETSASQLTYHGLSELASKLKEDDLAVFFRNNHFSTIYKHKGELFLLVTDQGYLNEPRVVWETLANVEGDGELVDCDFQMVSRQLEPLEPPMVAVNTPEQINHDLLLAMSLQEQIENSVSGERASAAETDEQFAKRLQEEEELLAATQHQQEAYEDAPQVQQGAEARRRSPIGNKEEQPGRQRKKSCIVL